MDLQLLEQEVTDYLVYDKGIVFEMNKFRKEILDLITMIYNKYDEELTVDEAYNFLYER